MAPSSGNVRTPALKTYSKRVKEHPSEPPSKRQRVGEPALVTPPLQVEKTKGGTIQSYFKPLPRSSSRSATRRPHFSSDPFEHTSSTAASQLSSDPLEPSSTPPSSPPARPEPTIEHPRRSQKRPKRRLTTRPVLEPIVNMSPQGTQYGYNEHTKPNSQRGSAHAASGPTDPAKCASQDDYPTNPLSTAMPDFNATVFTKQAVPHASASARSRASSLISQKLQQSQLDIGVPSIIVCKECGMQYNTTLKEDQRNHNKHHGSLYAKIQQPTTVEAGVKLMQKFVEDTIHEIRGIDYRVSASHKKKGYLALDETSRDLEGTIPTSDELWSLITNPQDKNDSNQVPRFKLFLYLINLQPVGVLLAERWAGEGDYYHSDPEFMKDGEVYMCVDRIWVREDMRRKGVASSLVSMAREYFIPGLSLSTMQFAFSHPTGMGREFADAYTKL